MRRILTSEFKILAEMDTEAMKASLLHADRDFAFSLYNSAPKPTEVLCWRRFVIGNFERLQLLRRKDLPPEAAARLLQFSEGTVYVIYVAKFFDPGPINAGEEIDLRPKILLGLRWMQTIEFWE